MRLLSLASFLSAVAAINSQAGPAAASVRLGRAPSAEDRAIPEPQPSGGRPQPVPHSKAVALRARSLEDRPGPARGSLEDAKAIFGRELEEFECSSGVGFVECEDGMEVVGGLKTQTTCADACLTDAGESQCCQGLWACDEFTGRVCRDGSCYGKGACIRSNIALVDNSCIGELETSHCNPGACNSFMKSKTTPTVHIKNSCQGTKPCGFIADGTGSLGGDIIDSCKGFLACYAMARQGTINGDIRNSCITENVHTASHTCYGVAEEPSGLVGGDIIDSCYTESACHYLAYRGTIEGVVKGSCQGRFSCSRFVAHRDSLLPHINGCCNTARSRSQVGECYTGINQVWEETYPVHSVSTSNVPAVCIAPIPTPSPTSSPTPSNIWTLDLQDTAATLATDADDDIMFAYLIAAGRDYEISLREKGCAEGDEVDKTLYTVTKSTAFFNSTHQWLNVSYSLDKAALASSSIWDNSTSTIELCQVTGLTTTDPTLGNLTVAQSVTELEVIVNSVANFTIKANLTGETIFNETEEVDAAAAVKAFKCDTEFEENNEPLSPNAELFTCVGSNDDAFKVETVDRMTIKQSGKNELKVIDGGKVQIPSITSTEPLAEGIIVRSRIPINLFDFEEGKILTIEGAVTMKLADGSSRRLNVELGSIARGLQDESNEASYTVEVALEAAEESAVDLSNSAAGVAAAGLKGFAIAAFFLLL